MIKPRGEAFQVDLRVGGKRHRKQFPSWSEAKAFEDSLLASHGLGPSPDTYPSEGLSGAVERLSGVLWGDTEHSIKVACHLKEVIEVLGDVPVDQFGDEQVEKLLAHYRKIGNSNATINRKFASLSKLFRHLHRTQKINFMPYFPRQKEAMGRIRFLTYEEEEALFHYLRLYSEDEYRLAVFLVETGARFSEALKLDSRDVDKKTKSVTFWETKSNHSRTVYLTERALGALDLKSGLKKPFGKVNRWTFRDHWLKARDLAGLGDDPLVVPHILRHTCASRLVQGGVDLRRVQEWMGHRSMQMTMRYAHLAPTDLKQCVEALSRGRGGTVDTADLKSASHGWSEGSSPSVRTTFNP